MGGHQDLRGIKEPTFIEKLKGKITTILVNKE